MPTNGYVDRIALNQLMKRMDDVSSLVNSATRNVHNGGPYTLPQLGIRDRGRTGATDRRKDIDAECGYPLTEELDLEHYQKFFDRLPEGKKAVTLLPKETWKVHPKLVEGDGSKEDTPFLKAWDEVCTNLGQMGKSYHKKQEGSKLWNYLRRFDELAGIGHYGVLLIGLNDNAKSLEDPVEGIDPDTGEFDAGDKALKDRKILFLQPFSEMNAVVCASETDEKSPRFGAPTYYDLNFERAVTGGQELTTKRVHWSRVVHFADNTDGNDYIGVPRMRPCFNQLINLYLLYGCSAEMFWNGAFPPTYFSSHPQLGGDVVIDRAAFKGQMEKLMSGLQRWAILMGLQPQQLQQTLSDPTPQITLNRKAISLILDIPDRIFEGSERGELSSAQDSDEWENRLNGRRIDVATPDILHPVTDRFIAYGVLPAPSDEGYAYEWPEKDNMSKLEKAQANLAIVQTMATYVSGNVETLLERKRFLTKYADMTEEEAEENMTETEAYEEEVALEEEQQMQAQQDQALALAKAGGKAPPQGGGKPPFGANPKPAGGKPAPFTKNAEGVDNNCGTGAGGFQPGNDCAKGGGGSEEPKLYRGGQDPDDYDGKSPDVDWDATDNYGYAWDEETVAEHLKVDHGMIYPAMIDMGELTYKVAEREEAADIRRMSRKEFEEAYGEVPDPDEDDEDAEDWKQARERVATEAEESWESLKSEEFARPSRGGYPPIVVTRVGENDYRVEDGNHRVDTWSDQGFDVAPAWVNDVWLAKQAETRGATENVFCPTGEGGGVDPTCSPGGSGGGQSIPEFESYEDSQAWMKERARAYKSKNAFYASEEYRAAYPALERARESHNKEYTARALKAMEEAGVSEGDRVVRDVPSAFGTVERYSGVLRMVGGVPRVKFDAGQTTMTGAKSSIWHRGWQKET